MDKEQLERFIDLANEISNRYEQWLDNRAGEPDDEWIELRVMLNNLGRKSTVNYVDVDPEPED